ncbi:outer membrane beta-barrel protein [Vibrio toranzoniae]|uniref:outer membrane beta-barrel protein n=1 Tax=Vibrio toranzoniae TaxID=1194427 RepID=UPI001378D2F7|nr:outer membrane beta-barrel protein [Vibrio toranzoniae]NAZ46456.1 outer membrane beta-barrel protein [Vibrio toranzoniae]NAZ53612.1 outer membrane beta-barrel protein [Vibrio toranzoniae]
MSKWKLSLVSTVFVFSPSLWAETHSVNILDYNHIYATAHSGSLNEDAGGNNNASSFGLGASYAVTDDWLLLADYNARFIHPDKSTTRIDTLMPGVGYRYSIKKDLDIVASYLLGITKGESELNSSNKTLESDTEFIQGVKAELNYGFAKRWIANGSVQVKRSDLFDEEIYHLGLRYLVTNKFAIGGSYQHRDGEGSKGGSERTNELGVEFFLEY